MFAEYFLEEYGRETLQTDKGFIMYVVHKESAEVFITDLYTKPDFRKGVEPRKLFRKVLDIAKENHCERITCLLSHGIQPKERTTRKLRAMLALGFQTVGAKNGQIILEYPVD
jgi:GNAT superfamily N-acetyltransferase